MRSSDLVVAITTTILPLWVLFVKMGIRGLGIRELGIRDRGLGIRNQKIGESANLQKAISFHILRFTFHASCARAMAPKTPARSPSAGGTMYASMRSRISRACT